jgi:hypothetical protein
MYVTCSWCHKRGHNRLSCPERKKHCEANPDSHEAYVLRVEAERRRNSVSKRACTYCSEKGHNRRGCQALKEDKALVTKKNNLVLVLLFVMALMMCILVAETQKAYGIRMLQWY